MSLSRGDSTEMLCTKSRGTRVLVQFVLWVLRTYLKMCKNSRSIKQVITLTLHFLSIFVISLACNLGGKKITQSMLQYMPIFLPPGDSNFFFLWL